VQLPLSICTLDMSHSKIRGLAACWNDAFRKIFGFNQWESVKPVQHCYGLGLFDVDHYYDIHRWRFSSNIGNKVPYLNNFFIAKELEQHVCVNLEHAYCVSDSNSLVTSVYKMFSSMAGCGFYVQ